VVFTLEDGSKQAFRALVPQLKSELLLSHLVTELNDWEAYFAGDYGKLRKVTALEFSSRSEWAFDKSFQGDFQY